MKKNIGQMDRSVRIIVALLLFALYAGGIATGVAAVVMLILSIVLLLTSLFGICPLYMLLKINTCSPDKGVR